MAALGGHSANVSGAGELSEVIVAIEAATMPQSE
jgi:hypothetical protein